MLETSRVMLDVVASFNGWLETDASLDKSATNFIARVAGHATPSPDNLNYFHPGDSIVVR